MLPIYLWTQLRMMPWALAHLLLETLEAQPRHHLGAPQRPHLTSLAVLFNGYS